MDKVVLCKKTLNEKGISLVALVITIIILLILAGVAVSISLNRDSIFAKANEAKSGWNAKATVEEDEMWNVLSAIGIEKPANRDEDNPTAPTKININKTDLTVTATGGSDASSNVAGYEYSLDQATWSKVFPDSIAYKIGEEIIGDAPAWGTVEDTKIQTIGEGEETKVVKAPIPLGFTASDYAVTGFEEDKISTGLVIYEGTESVAANHDTAMASRNQFVWIPVNDINDMLMCTGGGKEETITVYVRTVDTTGNVSEASSEEISLTSEESICNLVFDKTGNLVCTTHMVIPENEHFLCGKLYGSGENFGTQNPTTYTYNSGYREPAVVTNKSSATNLTNYLTGTSYDGASSNFILKEDGTTSVTGASNILTELKRQFNAMAKSVATYGGFYVGRYEAGNDASVRYATRKGIESKNILNAGSYDESTNPGGVNNWYGLYNKIIQENTGTVSQMIWGCQWEQVMKFVDGNRDNNGVGDIYSVTAAKSTRHKGDKAATGNNTNDLVQNIYDLEGNYREWTSTANNAYGRAFRGGRFSVKSAASYRDNDVPTDSERQLFSSSSALCIAVINRTSEAMDVRVMIEKIRRNKRMKRVKFQKEMLSEKGITLIALVITVIVLLILAGAAVSIGLNGNNVFEKANMAKDYWNVKVTDENTQLNNLMDFIEERRATFVDNLADKIHSFGDYQQITKIERATQEPAEANKTDNNIISTVESEYPIYMWNENNVLYWYSEANKLELPADCSSLFAAFRNLKDASGIRGWDTGNVTNMGTMFAGCYSLRSLDVSKWNTSSVTNMTSMFIECSSLTDLDVSKWNTSSVTEIGSMFRKCSSLENLDVSNWNTINVTYMSAMFAECSSLTNLNVSRWNTDKVTSLNGMFAKCSSLTNLNVSNWNVSNIENMGGCFSECVALTSLDLSNWNTSKVNYMDGMFSMSNELGYTSVLQSIKVSPNFTTNAVTSSTGMFDDCVALVGGQGTVYDASNTNASYAHIDGGPSNPGYFTLSQSAN